MSAYPKPPKRATGDVPAKTVKVLRLRSRGKCEACHMAPATEKHHRKYKTRGGTHEIQNLLHLCGGAGGMFGGNHSGCHGLAHSRDGQDQGLSVASWDDPAAVIFMDNYGVEWELFADGTKRKWIVAESKFEPVVAPGPGLIGRFGACDEVRWRVNEVWYPVVRWQVESVTVRMEHSDEVLTASEVLGARRTGFVAVST